MDALDPRGLDGILDDDVRVLAAITAAALRAGSAAAPAVVTFPREAEAPRPEILGRSRAMDQLRALPPELQGKAIEKMDEESFERFLKQMPEEKRDQFGELLKNTQDPERKLRL